jgi:hypothetical protein
MHRRPNANELLRPDTSICRHVAATSFSCEAVAAFLERMAPDKSELNRVPTHSPAPTAS